MIDKVSILSSYLIFCKWLIANSALLSKSLLNIYDSSVFSLRPLLFERIESKPLELLNKLEKCNFNLESTCLCNESSPI